MDSSNNIEIKRIGVEDAVVLSDIAVRAYKDHYLHLWFDKGEWYIEKSFSSNNLRHELEDTNAWFFIIFYNGEAAGFLKLNINAPFQGEANALELERIYLTKPASGKGIGKYVYEFVVNIAKQHDKKLIWLKVMDSSSGPISFYKKMGFEICGTAHLNFETMKPELRGMYVMKREIK